MSVGTSFSTAWPMFLPEMGLTAAFLGVFFSSLYAKSISFDQLTRGSMLILKLVLLSLFFLGRFQDSFFNGAFIFNASSLFLKGLFTFSGIMVIFMTREYAKTLGNRASDFLLITLVALLGTYFLASAGDLITLFISIEWITISLYVMTAYLVKDKYSLESGTKYLVAGAFSAALFLYGISLVYGATGTLQLNVDGWATPATMMAGKQASPLLTVGLLLMLAGIGFKISAFPFQFWVPDVYEGAPTPVTGFLSVISKTAGFVALVKILPMLTVGATHASPLDWPVLANLLAVATILYGNLGALGQTNMKRLFAYSSIGHAGYLLIGLACGTRFGVEATLFYLLAYVLSNMTAFSVIVIANRELGSGQIADYRGLAKRQPVLAAVFFVSLLSLGGIPPLAGFFGKFLVLQAAVNEGYLWLALIGAANVVVSLYYYLSIVKEMYLKEGTRSGKIKLAWDVRAALVSLAIVIVLLGVFQAPLLKLVSSAAGTFF